MGTIAISTWAALFNQYLYHAAYVGSFAESNWQAIKSSRIELAGN